MLSIIIVRIIVYDLGINFCHFSSRGNESVPPREWAGGVKGDGTSVEEEVVRTFCRNC